MAGTGGKRTGAGRKKGSINKRSQEIADRLAAMGCDPIEGMAEIAAEARGEGDLQLAGQMYKELAQYVAPKRKAVEFSGQNGNPFKGDITVNIVRPD